MEKAIEIVKAYRKEMLDLFPLKGDMKIEDIKTRNLIQDILNDLIERLNETSEVQKR